VHITCTHTHMYPRSVQHVTNDSPFGIEEAPCVPLHEVAAGQGHVCRLHAVPLIVQRVVELPHIALGAGSFLCHMIRCRNEPRLRREPLYRSKSVAHQCVLEVANPLVRVEAAVSHLDTLSLSFFFFSQKQATVQASSTQCLATASQGMKHILFGFNHFSRSSVNLSGVKRFKETFLCTRVCVFVCLCVCVASVVCVPRARPRDPGPVTPSPLSPPRASRAFCALRAGTKCVRVDLYI
jgi:hypothetical protein